MAKKNQTQRNARKVGEPRSDWTFEQTHKMGGASGEAFTNTLAATGMNPAAVLAREAIQNSVDARSDEYGKVLVRFRTVSLRKAEKKVFVEAAKLHEIADRASALNLPSPNCLESFERANSPLNLLFVEDYHTTGLTGDPFDASSKYHRFLLSLGDGSKVREAHGTGGSFGFGKSVYSSNSSIMTIFAYSRYLDDRGKSRSRITGCGYFTSHGKSGKSYTGRAWYGIRAHGTDSDHPEVLPLEDGAAEQLAERLQFKRRSQDEYGLSVLIIDADVEMDDILRGVEDWWWPRLIKDALDVEVESVDGKVVRPRPRFRPDLQPFIDAFYVADGSNPVISGRDFRKSFNKFDRHQIGICGFRVLERAENDELPVCEDRIDSVALIRSPQMVVAYHRISNAGTPSMVGVFIASDEIDDILRASESPAHDRWDKDSPRLRSSHGESRKIVETTLGRIQSSFRDFQKSASPPPPPRPRRLAILERTLAAFLSSGKGGSKDKPESLPAPIHLAYEHMPFAEAMANGFLQMKAEFSVRLKSDVDVESMKLRLRVSCPVLEDDSEGESLAITTKTDDVVLIPVAGEPNAFVFELKQGRQARIRCESELYDPLWTVRFKPEVEPLEEVA